VLEARPDGHVGRLMALELSAEAIMTITGLGASSVEVR
jgi:hypothetical protein